MELEITLGQLDKKYGKCNDYFAQKKINWGLKSNDEVEAEYNRRMKETKYVNDRLQRMYYTLYDRRQLSNFGRLLVEHGVYTSFVTARRTMVNGLGNTKEMLSRKSVIDRKMKMIKLYPVFLKQYTRKRREKGSR